ncbi:MAG: hypothetical protein Q4P29_02195 [Tissierellia bacterium]|nr:hypothetical protein [Tissierellia bacterium]
MNKNILRFIKRVLKLQIGFMLIALGTVFALKSNLGLNSWGILHEGLSKQLGISFGRATQLVGLILITINAILGMWPGIGTVINMICIGLYTDLFIFLLANFTFNTFISRLLILLCGLIFIGFGSAHYITVKMGTGPRDGLTLTLTKLSGLKVSIVRIILEVTAIILGYLMGGTFGIGTFLSGALSGPILGKSLEILKYDPKVEKQENARDTINSILGKN